jgi:hypothetical protein
MGKSDGLWKIFGIPIATDPPHSQKIPCPGEHAPRGNSMLAATRDYPNLYVSPWAAVEQLPPAPSMVSLSDGLGLPVEG